MPCLISAAALGPCVACPCACVRACMRTCVRTCVRGAHAKALSSRICFARALVFGAFSIVWISNDSAPLVGRYLYTPTHTHTHTRMCVRIGTCVSADSEFASPSTPSRAIAKFSRIVSLKRSKVDNRVEIFISTFYLRLLSTEGWRKDEGSICVSSKSNRLLVS